MQRSPNAIDEGNEATEDKEQNEGKKITVEANEADAIDEGNEVNKDNEAN